MSLMLTSAELQLLDDASQVLSRPIEFSGADAWRSAVLGILKPLLHADTAGFHLPVGGAGSFYSEDYRADELVDYPDLIPPALSSGVDSVTRAVQLGTGTLEGMYGPHMDRYLRSDYHNEYARLLGKRHTLFAAVGWGGGGEDEVACVQLFRAGKAGFGERECSLLSLLMPSYRAGVEAWVRCRSGDRWLVDLLNGLSLAAAVYDWGNGTRLQTARLEELLRGEPRRALFEAAMEACALRLAGRSGTRHVGLGEEAAAQVPPELATAGYTLQGWQPEQHGAEGVGGPMVVVSLRRVRPLTPTAAELQQRFGLTAAQGRVAQLLIAGRTNLDIARALTISEHTARRHTERVFQKLGVRTRAEAVRHCLS
jgi:DNA-binding CsgD family transcriptional regulator